MPIAKVTKVLAPTIVYAESEKNTVRVSVACNAVTPKEGAEIEISKPTASRRPVKGADAATVYDAHYVGPAKVAK